MGTIGEKLAYLNTTKNEIRKAINSKNGNLTDSSTFREYAQAINKIPYLSNDGFTLNLNDFATSNCIIDLNMGMLHGVAVSKTGSTVYDPLIVSGKSINLDATIYNRVAIKFSTYNVSSLPQAPELYWTFDYSSDNWNLDNHVIGSYSYSQINAMTTVVFDLSNNTNWKGQIGKIRFDPFDNSSGEFWIESICIYKSSITSTFIADAINNATVGVIKAINGKDGFANSYDYSTGFLSTMTSPWMYPNTKYGYLKSNGKYDCVIPTLTYCNGELYNSIDNIYGCYFKGQNIENLAFLPGGTRINLLDFSIGTDTTIDTVYIPNSVNFINTNTFTGCGVKTIIIDSNSTAISGSPWGATNATIIYLR